MALKKKKRPLKIKLEMLQLILIFNKAQKAVQV